MFSINYVSIIVPCDELININNSKCEFRNYLNLQFQTLVNAKRTDAHLANKQISQWHATRYLKIIVCKIAQGGPGFHLLAHDLYTCKCKV